MRANLISIILSKRNLSKLEKKLTKKYFATTKTEYFFYFHILFLNEIYFITSLFFLNYSLIFKSKLKCIDVGVVPHFFFYLQQLYFEIKITQKKMI